MKNNTTKNGLSTIGAMLLFLGGALVCHAQTVTGTVSAEDGPLPGASIVIKGTSQGTTTDFDGNFSIEATAENTLVFSYIGYAAKEITVGSQSQINVVLQADNALDEVVVIGYGTQRKSDLTGSVSTVDTDDIKDIPNSRVDQVLQGRSAGVQVTQTSGAPGAGTSIRVRGGNSIVGSNEPLWVIDGIIVGQNFDLNNINSNDIKSIEILKDASSVAIYGSRGANGVVLVTTKSGVSVGGGKPQISANISTAIQSVPETPAFLSQPQQIAFTNESSRFRSAAEPFPNPAAETDTDWFGLLTGPAPIYNADVSIAGSSENSGVTYYVSTNYFNQDGLIQNSGIEKYIYRSNLDIKLSDKLKAGFRINYARTKQDNGTVSYGSLLTALSVIPVRNPDGTFNGENQVVGAPFANPVANAQLNINETTTNNLLGTVYLEYRPSEKWVIRSTFNPEINNVKTNILDSSRRPDFLAVGDKGVASVATTSSVGWNNENTVQYQSDFGEKHNLSLLGGASFQKYEEETSFAQAFGLTSDATGFNNLGLGTDPTRNIIGSGYDAFQIVSFFGRANYAYKDKYLLTLVGRTDGASRFAPGNQYEFYPSVAAAWKITEEPFMQNQEVFKDLKLRASYGRSGSQAIDSYRTFAILDEASTTYNGIQSPGVTLGRPENENLKWETTKQLDIALEASLFNGRLFTEINYYKKQTEDLLLDVRLPLQTGFVSQLQNLGKVENKGVELLINSTNVATDNFSWSTSLTFSANRNKVLNIGDTDFIDIVTGDVLGSGNTRILVGEPSPVFTGVNYLGTWKSQEEIDASGQLQQVVGGPRFDDTNGDGIISSDDYYVLGSPQADFIYGLQNSFTYKDFEFSFFIQGTQGNEVFNLRTEDAYFKRGETPKYAELADRWTPENPTSDLPRAGSDAVTDIPINSKYIEDGSHLRLKTARLAYNLPIEKMGLNGLKDMTLYFAGSNLFLLSDFRLIDPETSSFGRDNVRQGFSNGEYPNPRTLTLGLNLTF